MPKHDDDDDAMHLDMPDRPQFPQGPPLRNNGLDTPNTTFSEGETPGDRDRDRETGLVPSHAHRYSMASHYRSLLDDNTLTADKPPIPSALPSSIESAPLPKIPMIVLSIVRTSFEKEEKKTRKLGVEIF